jgi:Sulfatase
MFARACALILAAGSVTLIGLVAVSATRATPAAPPVVVLILDEFPGDNLLASDGRIDAFRYPGFAALAARATWFPNASTANAWTSKAVPGILDGVQPALGVPPTRGGHPHSLYGALVHAGYEVIDSEESTHLCPPRWCRAAEIRRPACRIRHCLFLGEGRLQRFERWLDTIRPRARPTFWMKHLLLPHRPWVYLPSGLRTGNTPGLRGPIHGMNRQGVRQSRFLELHNYQRHLLQLQFTDSLVARLLHRLVARAMLEESLVVVVADHGYSFVRGAVEHRALGAANVHQIAPVPLFIKAPGQTQGRIDGAYASNLDVTPTIAELLHVPLGYQTAGRPVTDPAVRQRRSAGLADVVGVPPATYLQRRFEAVRLRLRLFGEGPKGLYDGIGPHHELVGRRARSLRAGRRTHCRAHFFGSGSLRHVRRAGGTLPAQIAGDVLGSRRGSTRNVAVSVNGRIEAVGRSFRLHGDGTEHFSLMVPEGALHEGRNRVRLFQVGPGRVLRPLGRA